MTASSGCASCGSAVPEGELECPECGNRPEFDLRRIGAVFAILGSFGAPLIDLYGGAAMMAIGFGIITLSAVRSPKPTEYDLPIFD
jgi:hypothetical protein